jgi:hypothetical protein
LVGHTRGFEGSCRDGLEVLRFFWSDEVMDVDYEGVFGKYLDVV